MKLNSRVEILSVDNKVTDTGTIVGFGSCRDNPVALVELDRQSYLHADCFVSVLPVSLESLRTIGD